MATAADDLLNFRGSAFDTQGDLLDDNLQWSVNGTAIGTGKLLTAKIGKERSSDVTLTATNSAEISAAVAVLVKLRPPNDNSSIKVVSPLNKTVFF